MRILFLWEGTDWGGVESWLAYLLNDWPESKATFTLVTNEGNLGASRLKSLLHLRDKLKIQYITSLFRARNPPTRMVRLRKIVRSIVNLFIFPVLFALMVRKYFLILRDSNYDVVMGINGGYPAAVGVLAGMIGARLAKIPVRTLVVHHEARKPAPMTEPIMYSIDIMLSYSLSSLVSISKATQESLKRNTRIFFNHNLHSVVIYDGVPQRNHTPSRSANLENEPEVTQKEIFNLCIMGRIDDYKGHEDVIFALSYLPTPVRNEFRLNIIGTGSEKTTRRLQELVARLGMQDQVIFRGYIEGDSQDIISGFDAVIIATRNFEGFGLTAAEAMNAHVPLICANAGALGEVANNEVATMFQPGDVTELSNIFLMFRENQEIVHNKARKAAIWVTKFSARDMSLNYQRHIEQKVLSNS